MEEQLKQLGYTKEQITFSFTPKFEKQSGGYFWMKRVPFKDDKDIEIGILLNPEYKSMEVYICDCVVGCCGNDYGIHPFSIAKINELFLEELKSLTQVYG